MTISWYSYPCAVASHILNILGLVGCSNRIQLKWWYSTPEARLYGPCPASLLNPLLWRESVSCYVKRPMERTSREKLSPRPRVSKKLRSPAHSLMSESSWKCILQPRSSSWTTAVWVDSLTANSRQTQRQKQQLNCFCISDPQKLQNKCVMVLLKFLVVVKYI